MEHLDEFTDPEGAEPSFALTSGPGRRADESLAPDMRSFSLVNRARQYNSRLLGRAGSAEHGVPIQMSLRLIQISVPAADRGDVRGAIEDVDIVGAWSGENDEDVGQVNLLVRTEDTENVLDQIEARFGSSKGFRLMLLPIEATLPRVEDPEEDDDAADGDEGDDDKPPTPRISREELYNDLSDGIRLTRVYVVTAALSAIVAAVGLIRDDGAVVIGAMVIAPLLTPNMALSLATTLGDLKFGRKALWTNLVGVGIVLALAIGIGFFAPLDFQSEQLAGRAKVNLGDIVLALAAGAVGAQSFVTGVASGLIGVMVAVALLPPLVALGLFIGAGKIGPAAGAALLLSINVICVNLAGMLTFVSHRIRPRTWWEADQAKRYARIGVITWSVLLAILTGLVIYANQQDSIFSLNG